jgi:IclR family pca regulon transcriptional regulator
MGRLTEEDGARRQARELPGAASPADFSEALARGLAVLEAFGSDRRRVTQAELARELGLSRATVRRAVLTLRHLGYLSAEGRSYELTPSILRLAQGYLASNPLSAVVQPACERVADKLQASCSVAVLDGEDAVIVARAAPQRLAAAASGVGLRVSASRSALGKVLLAHQPAAGDADSAPPPGVEPQVLAKVRAHGYCYVANDVEAGFHSIAVPLRRWDGQVLAAMNVGSTIDQLRPDDMHGNALRLLREQADELHKQLI